MDTNTTAQTPPSPPSTHRVKCGPKFAGQSSRFDGRIVGARVHDTNGLPMVLLAFPNAAHQQFWGGTWLYLDDLEMLTPGADKS